MARCENCGKRTPDTDSLCPSCLHHKKKVAAKAAADGREADGTPPAPAERPDVEALKERLRRIEEGLSG